MHLPRTRIGQVLLLLTVALASRIVLFGNPVIQSDEEFYLLVGDRMLQGAWPFVDIFDRKPVGLFLVFAGIRTVGGDGVLAYQIAALLVATATAFVVARIVSRFAGRDAGVGGGLIYLVWLVVFDGGGGQSAVWGNAAMAVAALLALDAARGHRWITARGIAAMLLIGCAMQIKYTAMFEGIFFGLTLLWAGHHAGRSRLRIVGDGALWVGAALLPTALAWGTYAWAGHNDVFVFANFLSIFGQGDHDGVLSNLRKLVSGVGLGLPLFVVGWQGRRHGGLPIAWVGAGVVAILIMHTFEPLYWLPLALPLAVAAGTGLERAGGGIRRGVLLAVLVFGAVAATLLTRQRLERRGDAAQIDRLVAMIGQRPAGCLFAFDSNSSLYFLTRSCLPTPYVFRTHLARTTELHGIGIDPVAEVARVLATRPGTIVIRDAKPDTNPAARALVTQAIAARYRLVGTGPVGDVPQSVYRLRPGA